MFEVSTSASINGPLMYAKIMKKSRRCLLALTLMSPVHAPVATTLAGTPTDPGVILTPTDSIVVPAGSEVANTFLTSWVVQDENFGLRSIATSSSRSLCDR